MSLTVEATYENGVLKPVQALPLKEHQRVQVTVHSPAPDIVQAYRIMGWKGDAETLRRIALDPEFLAEVYAKRPFGGAQQVFRYLGRYSHRVAIANSRLLALADGQVSFSWKDYADDQRTKVMRLTADEFIRRFLLHVLPKRFVRLRHYGLLAGRHAAQ